MTWHIDIPSRNIVRIFGFVTAIIALLIFAYFALEALGVLIVAAFLAMATHKPVTFLAKYVPVGGRKLAALGVFMVIAVIAGLIVYLIIPLITEQGQELIAKIPAHIESLRSGETVISRWLLEFNVFSYLETFLTGVFQGIVHSAQTTVDILKIIIKNAIAIFFAILIGFALVVEGPQKLDAIDSLLSPGTRKHVRTLRNRMFHAVTGFVNGQLIITTISATATFILLTILGVPAPLSLAAVVWLTGLIPLIGNTLGAIVVILVTLSQSMTIALFFVIFYIIYQQIENNVLSPIIQARTVHLTPLTVLISAFVGVTIAGFLGALLAVPIGASVRAVVEYYFEQRGSPAKP